MNYRSYISVFLLAIWLTPQGFGLACDIRKWEIKKQQQHKQHTGLQTLHIRATEVRWMDKKEIFVNGKMFDLLDIQLEKGWYTFTGVYDDAETELVMWQQQSAQSEQDQALLTALFIYLQQVYFHADSQGRLTFQENPATWLVREQSVPELQSPDIQTPPPRAAFPYC